MLPHGFAQELKETQDRYQNYNQTAIGFKFTRENIHNFVVM